MSFSVFLYNRTYESGVRSSEGRLLIMDTAIGRQCLLMNHLLSDLREERGISVLKNGIN